MADLDRSSSTPKTTSVHVTALDSIVSVNGLFTAIVFLGISFNSSSSSISTSCAPGATVFKNLVVLEVVSFSCFLFSSLIAHGLKLHINLLNSYNASNSIDAHIEKRLLKFGLVASSAGSAFGCVFLMMAMVNVVQIRLGTLSCSKDSMPVVAVLVFLVSSAILIFSYAVYDATKVSQCRHNNSGQELKQMNP